MIKSRIDAARKTNRLDLGGMVSGTRAIHDTVAKLIMDGVLHRFPNVRLLSVENGSDWLVWLKKRLLKKANQTPELFPEDPADVIRARVFTTPYAEDDLSALVEQVGADNILFGSDWPHGEGLADPLSYRSLVSDLSQADADRIMRTNLAEMIAL